MHVTRRFCEDRSATGSNEHSFRDLWSVSDMTDPSGSAAIPSPTSRTGSDLTPLATSQGKTQIADTVVSKIAGVAARDVSGVFKLGGGTSRALGSIRERIPGASTNASQGVSVEVGEKQAAVDVDLVVEYGVSISDLAAAVRRNVITSLERMTGLEVVEVNVNVNDLHLPSDDADEPADPSAGARVQ
jgi:uncharacterized alkaline shock family protein YloU